MLVVGISGAKRSGKSYVAQALENKFSKALRVRSIAFADGLKDAIYPAFLAATGIVKTNGRPIEIFLGDAYKNDETNFIRDDKGEEVVNMRQILQKTGTDFFRNHLGIDDFWVAYAQKQIFHTPFKYQLLDIKGNKAKYAEILGLNPSDRYEIRDCQTGQPIKFDAETFINGVIYKLESLKFNDFLKDDFDLCLVTDVRFDNELDFVKGHGGSTYYIHRKEADGTKIEVVDSHSSENITEYFKNNVINVTNRIGKNDAVMRIADDIFDATLLRTSPINEEVSISKNINDMGVA